MMAHSPDNSRDFSLGIVGYPLSHTLSPILHAFFLEQTGIQGAYAAYETPPNFLATRLDALAAMGVRGLNVTIPHKRAVIPLLTRVADDAAAVQAVNTIVLRPDGTREGFNTDIPGFWDSLPPEGKSLATDGRTLLLGAGGAARAALAALIQAGAQRLTIATRNPDRAYDTLMIADDLCRRAGSACDILLVALSELASLEPYGLVINTTPIGMGDSGLAPLTASQLSSLPDPSFVYDAVYGRAPTRLIRECQSMGIPACDGLNMLVRQGARAFTLWTGAPLPDKTLTEAVRHLRASA